MDWQPILEARLERTDAGELVPADGGWFVVNASQARGLATERFGASALFEGAPGSDARFAELGLHLHVLRPGQPNGMYHREANQEGYLVLHGECTLIVEDEERPLRQWDYAHLPAGTAHICIGAGDGPCAVLMVGTRRPDAQIVCPVSHAAARYGASVERETGSGGEAYAGMTPPARRPLDWPPG